MLNRIIKNVVIIGVLIANYGCSKDESGIDHRKLTGIYNLSLVERSGLVTESNSTYGIYEDITKDCDTHNTIEFKANGTVELIEFSGNNCINQTVKNGTWNVTSTPYGNFVGEVRFNNSKIVYELYETQNINDEIAIIRIEYYDENPPENIELLRYHYTFKRAY